MVLGPAHVRRSALPLLSALALAMSFPACAATPATGPQESAMDTNLLVNQVKANDPHAIGTAAKLGAPASAALEPLAGDPKPEVRLMALSCLETTGGESAIRAALAHLNDNDEQVLGEALQVLHHNPPVDQAAALLAAFNNPRFPVVREETPMIAGRLAPKVDPQPWKALWVKERDPLVKDRLLVGLARMGDAQARDLFAKNLQASRGSDTVTWINYARYMQDKWVVPALAPLLDRTDVVTKLAPDMKNTLPQRACDLAVKAIVELTGMKLPFEVVRVQQFTPDEINQVRRALAAVK